MIDECEFTDYRCNGLDCHVSDAMVERARIAAARWFAEHADGASTDDDWRDHYRTVLMASLWGK